VTAIAVADMGETPPQAGITVTGAAGDFDVEWSIDGDEWFTATGGKNLPSPDAFVRDFFPPLNAPVTYRVVEDSGTITVAASTITFDSETGWLSDPLDPRTAVALVPKGWPDDEGKTLLTLGTEAEATYAQAAEVTQTFGARYPVISAGQRQAASAVPMLLTHDAATEGGALKRLLFEAGVLVYRPPIRGILDPVAYITLGDVKQTRHGMTSDIAQWEMTATQGRPVNLKLVIPWYTYEQVATDWNDPTPQTYADVLTARPGDTYLDWQADPLAGAP
jgi:hypothetical protein